jgi:hypothetical protein
VRKRDDFSVIARSPCNEAIQSSFFGSWIASSLRSSQ